MIKKRKLCVKLRVLKNSCQSISRRALLPKCLLNEAFPKPTADQYPLLKRFKNCITLKIDNGININFCYERN